jgi:hypothetical protein
MTLPPLQAQGPRMTMPPQPARVAIPVDPAPARPTLPPKAAEDDADFTSIIDNLGD